MFCHLCSLKRVVAAVENQRLELNAKYGTSNGYIRWLYTAGSGNIFNVQTDAVVTPGMKQRQ